METRFLLSDILEMLKLIKDDKGKQQKVRSFLKNNLQANVEDDEYMHVKDEDATIPMDIIEMLTAIKNSENKLLRLLTFIEDEILIKNVDKDEVEVVDEYKNIICQIIDGMHAGFITYVNPETLAMEQVQSATVSETDSESFEEQNDDMLDEYELEYVKWDDYIKFEPLGVDDLSTMMEDFIRLQNDKAYAGKLEDALTIQESPEEFTALIKTSEEHKQAWESFKRNVEENYVRSHLIEELKKREKEEIAEGKEDRESVEYIS